MHVTAAGCSNDDLDYWAAIWAEVSQHARRYPTWVTWLEAKNQRRDCTQKIAHAENWRRDAADGGRHRCCGTHARTCISRYGLHHHHHTDTSRRPRGRHEKGKEAWSKLAVVHGFIVKYINHRAVGGPSAGDGRPRSACTFLLKLGRA